jgi:hypothetical protein
VEPALKPLPVDRGAYQDDAIQKTKRVEMLKPMVSLD